MDSDETCRSCGASIVEGRINCPQCGATYPSAGERDLERDPDKQGDLPS